MAVMLGMTVTLTACKGNSVTPDMELAQSNVETIAVPECTGGRTWRSQPRRKRISGNETGSVSGAR